MYVGTKNKDGPRLRAILFILGKNSFLMKVCQLEVPLRAAGRSGLQRGGRGQEPYLNALKPVTSMPVISRWMSWVPS